MTQAGEAAVTQAAPRGWWRGVGLGSLGVLAFSGTLPATRIAVPALGPTIITYGRIEIAAILSTLALLLAPRCPRLRLRHVPGILWTGLGLAVGYPFFIALALERVPASHGAIVIALTPAVTAVIAVLRAGERPPPRFWLGCVLGVATVALFALAQAGGSVQIADGWLVAAMLSVGVAYVEGGRVSRELGGTVTLCWAMILLAPPAAVPLVAALRSHALTSAPGEAWAGFAYAGMVSMFLGSVAWYRGLAAGGIARIGQLNLAQPLLTLLWSALFLGERVTWQALLAAALVILAMAICVRSRVTVAAKH